MYRPPFSGKERVSAMKLLLLIVKNVGRNGLRSMLTALGTMVLVLVVTLVWSVLHLIDMVTEEKSHDIKAFISDRWSVPSRLPLFLRDRRSAKALPARTIRRTSAPRTR